MKPLTNSSDLAQRYQRVLDLCDALEAIADSLPQLDIGRSRQVAATIEPLMAEVHRLEEAWLFPTLAATPYPDLPQTLARLHAEHLADLCSAGEVSQTLHDATMGYATLSPDAIGYLLRSFFQSTRRHIHGDLALLQHLAPDRRPPV